MEAPAASTAHVELSDVHLAFGERRVFDDLSCAFAPGEISVVLGGSGSGKSTLLRLIGGLQRPDQGSVRVAGEDVAQLSERKLFRLRARIGMLFQGGALLDSLSIFENVALPLREHRRLPAAELEREVRRRLEAVGLPDVEDLLPGQLSGGMMRRAALARAIVNDPAIVLCDEPFSGLDPLNVRRIEALLTHLNRRLGLTLIVASHHIASALRMAHRLVFLLEGAALVGAPTELASSRDARVVQFLAAESAAADEVAAWEQARTLMLETIRRLGFASLRFVAELGRMAAFTAAILGAALRPPFRLGRLVQEIYDSGVLSLAIVCGSGLAVGAVLGLQGYNTLVRFGAEDSLGAVVGLSLIRELGPVLTGLLVTGRAGSAMAAEIASMNATEQLDGLRMMSIDPVDLIVTPKAGAMFLVMPLLSCLFILAALAGGYLIGVQLLGLDGGTYLTSLESAVDFEGNVAGSLLKALAFGALVGLVATYRGYTSAPTSAGVSAATTSTVVVASVSILLFDYVITALWDVYP